MLAIAFLVFLPKEKVIFVSVLALCKELVCINVETDSLKIKDCKIVSTTSYEYDEMSFSNSNKISLVIQC